MKKILLVDDEEGLHLLYKEEFEVAFPECELISAYSGKECLEILENVKPDIILLDINMPIMNGIQALQLIRKKYPFIPIVLVTAYQEYEYDYMNWFVADDYIVKSANFNYLIERINFFITNKMPRQILYSEHFPFPISYNFTCIRSRVNAKEVLDTMFNLCEYIIKYIASIMLANLKDCDNNSFLLIHNGFSNFNMTLGRIYEIFRKTSLAIKKTGTSYFVYEFDKLLYTNKGNYKELDEILEVVSLRNEIHKRPFTERAAEKIIVKVKHLLWNLMDKLIFLKNYELILAESIVSDSNNGTYIFHIKKLMGSHPEFIHFAEPITENLTLKQVYLSNSDNSNFLNLHPFIIFEFNDYSYREDVYLFDKFGSKMTYKSCQQGHNMEKEISYIVPY